MFKKSIGDMIAGLVKLLKEHNDPHGIALGMAVGSFIGITPLYGLHTVLCLLALLLIPRANKISILIGTNVSMPLTVVPITWTAYDIGRIILVNRNYPPLSLGYFKTFKIAKAGEFLYPLFTGSLVLALLVAAVLYLVTWAIVYQFRKRYATKR